MEEANEFLARKFLPVFNRRFAVPARETGEGFVPVMSAGLETYCVGKKLGRWTTTTA